MAGQGCVACDGTALERRAWCGICGEGPLCRTCLNACEQRCARAEAAAERWADEHDEPLRDEED
jgi:hypothetical protein